MLENSNSIVDRQVGKTTLSLQDFLLDRERSVVSEYLSLSITRFDTHLCIRLTTMDAQSISYKAIIPNSAHVDLDAVQFVMQSRRSVL